MPLPEFGVGPFPPGRDPDEYERSRRRVLWSMPSGLFVVGSRDGERRNLMTANWVMQIATVPKLVGFAVEAESVTRELVDGGGGFSVSMLPREARAAVRRFVKPVTDVELDAGGIAVMLGGEAVREVTGGLPCLAASVAWLSCEVRAVLDWDRVLDPNGEERRPASHVLVVGEVVDAGEWPESGSLDDVLAMGDTRMNYGG